MVEGLGVYINSSSARCMDGSSPIYWITKGQGSGVNKLLISFEEGLFCNLIDGGYDNCNYFAFEKKGGYPGTTSGYFGTSNASKVPEIFDFNNIYENYYSRDSSINPLMYNWNMVYMHYCDGSLWLGNLNDVIHAKNLIYIRGNANAMAILNDLMINQDMIDRKFATAFMDTGITDMDGVKGAFLDNCPHHYYVYNQSVSEPQVFQPWTDMISSEGSVNQKRFYLGIMAIVKQ